MNAQEKAELRRQKILARAKNNPILENTEDVEPQLEIPSQNNSNLKGENFGNQSTKNELNSEIHALLQGQEDNQKQNENQKIQGQQIQTEMSGLKEDAFTRYKKLRNAEKQQNYHLKHFQFLLHMKWYFQPIEV
ncbi:hypothetical protein PPERSA_12376 [Pseudocohnilembus persalinus]|uniref:Uncharacterized protein n=1 Tax=Pseudocohnilembus persalinus TaxID=266149 RepID=A0A0V0QG26_PSEPJ|nr:hypothetical protein PPERSA_12376 [Pseudocohnilembus persalinus]|eukprot:KRX01096.1 hypothetical protein PPERSA_12376 [Pseudocohnilembus persalinus]